MKNNDMEIKEISKLIDETELDLTPLQRALLSDVNYFNEAKGEFVYMESYLEDKYVDVLEGSTIKDEFNQLIELGYVDKYVKRRIYNGKFVTITLLSLTDTFLNELLSINDGIVKPTIVVDDTLEETPLIDLVPNLEGWDGDVLGYFGRQCILDDIKDGKIKTIKEVEKIIKDIITKYV